MPVGMGIFYAALVTALRATKWRAKLATMDWMRDAPRGVEGPGGNWLRTELADVHAPTRTRHEELGIARFDDPCYGGSHLDH